MRDLWFNPFLKAGACPPGVALLWVAVALNGKARTQRLKYQILRPAISVFSDPGRCPGLFYDLRSFRSHQTGPPLALLRLSTESGSLTKVAKIHDLLGLEAYPDP